MMRYPIELLSILFLSILLFVGCDDMQSLPDSDLTIEGKVTYVNIEGGFWAIEDGEETYEPVNLSEDFKQEGLKVTVHADIEKDKVSFRMVGPIIKITSISER